MDPHPDGHPMELRGNPIRPRSLRGQLIGLVAALAVPLIALQLWWGWRAFEAASDAAETEALTLADATAASVRQFLAQAEKLMTATAAQFGREYLALESCAPSMETLTNVYSFLVNALVADRDGVILCAARGTLAARSASEWSWYAPLRAGEPFAVAAPRLGTISETWVLPLAVPIHDEGGVFAGALVGSVPLPEFDRLIAPELRNQDILVTISDDQRRVIARSHDAERRLGQQLPPQNGWDVQVDENRWIARGRDFDGVDRAWGQVQMENGWVVYVGMRGDAVYGPARASVSRGVGATLVVLLLAMGLAGTAYRRIATALRELARGIPVPDEGGAIVLPEGTPAELRAVVEQFGETLRSRNEAEAAERSARERYQSIFDNAVFGLYVSTLDGDFLQVNPALVTMLRYESADALKEAGPAALYPMRGMRPQLIQDALEDGRIDDVVVEWLRADGMPITVRLNGRIITTRDGAPAFEMIVQDITEERRREDELRQTQKMEAIGKLAGGIAHDFNNLLTVIGGNVELIEMGLPPEHPLRADVDQIREATARAAGLTTQLLSFSRKERPGARTVDVNAVLANMERMLVRLIGEDIRLETRLSPELPHVAIDSAELEQVVMNLVLNARDAMPMGGRVTVETRCAAGPGKGGHEVPGVVLSVCDTGIGMDIETRKRIFEPFYTTKPVGEGTGLGLSTVYGIVQRADGNVHVETEPGLGTTIDIWLPRVSAHTRPEPKSSKPSQAAPAGGGEQILVAEDEELVRVFVRRALQDAGYRVVAAADGQEALEQFETDPSAIDLVLTDVVMPRMKGPELASRISDLSPETPILYMSGYVDNQALSTQLADRPEALLRKPFSAADLCARVRLSLDGPLSRQGAG